MDADMNSLKTEQGVKDYMGKATSEADWNNRCDMVKAANDGYPSFWYMAIVMSGLATKTAKNWNGDANIHLSVLKAEATDDSK